MMDQALKFIMQKLSLLKQQICQRDKIGENIFNPTFKNDSPFDDIYTPLSVAKEEVWRRWNDKDLRKKVEEFLGGRLPDIMGDEPIAVIFRNIATPSFEFERFMDLVSMINMKPACFELSADNFCTRNKDKICLGKLCFFEKGKHMNHFFKKVIDLKCSDNLPFCEIKTLGGESLIDFHHRMFMDKYGRNAMGFCDVSYLKKESIDVNQMYDKFLAFFVCFGILFENFIKKDGHYESSFTEKVVRPAIKKNIERFGIAPLIVPLLPISDEDLTIWMGYPNSLEKEMSVENKN